MNVSFGRVLGAAIGGGLALLVWGMVWWMALSPAIEPLGALPPEVESTITDAMLDARVEEGAYFVPGVAMDAGEEEMEAWTQKHKDGPLGLFLYKPHGVAPMQPELFVRGFAINFASCFLACVVILPGVRTGWGMGHKVAAVVCFGIVASLVGYGNLWNWMNAPTDFAWKMSADILGGWLIAGVVIGLILTPTAAPNAAPAE